MPPLLSAITGVLVMHQSLGNIAIDLLATIGAMDPKLGVPLLLAILFYCNIFTRNDINYQDMLVSIPIFLASCLVNLFARVYQTFPYVSFIYHFFL